MGSRGGECVENEFVLGRRSWGGGAEDEIFFGRKELMGVEN